MMKWKSAILISAALMVGGCAAESDGVDQQAIKEHSSNVAALAAKSGGDWNKLSEVEKRMVLDKTNGDEAQAQKLIAIASRGAPNAPQGPSGSTEK